MKKFTTIGALIGLVVISILLATNRHSSPTWGKWWQLKPIFVVSLTGAFAGSLIYHIHPKKPFSKWKLFLFLILSIVGFLVSIWFGIIVGLDGTLWN